MILFILVFALVLLNCICICTALYLIVDSVIIIDLNAIKVMHALPVLSVVYDNYASSIGLNYVSQSNLVRTGFVRKV